MERLSVAINWLGSWILHRINSLLLMGFAGGKRPTAATSRVAAALPALIEAIGDLASCTAVQVVRDKREHTEQLGGAHAAARLRFYQACPVDGVAYPNGHAKGLNLSVTCCSLRTEGEHLRLVTWGRWS